MIRSLLFLGLSLMVIYYSAGQATYQEIVTILQTKCSGSGCHNGVTPGIFSVAGSAADIYGRIVNVTPVNPAAAAKGYKLIDPGYPERSFLLRKIAGTFDPGLTLQQPQEGNLMPTAGTPLTSVEKELIRQWIQFGAPQTGTVVNKQILIDFYNNGKGLPRIPTPPAPLPSEGFQIHQGPIFLAPGEEREYQWRFDTKLLHPVEATRFVGYMSPQSHHLILYKYNPGVGNSEPQGFTLVDNIIDQFNIQINARILGVWQYNTEHQLPAGTAYFWESGAILNANFHVKNYSADSILAAEAYINVYTQPAGSGSVQMYSDLIVYGGMNPYQLNIPNTGNPITLTMTQTQPNQHINIWILQAHTHKLGVDYDIFLRNPDGTKGDQIYEGFFNADYTFNQGFYDYAHPPVRKFEPLLTVNMTHGLIHEATYVNNGPTPVGFGLTTDDEMFITYIHYTLAQPTSYEHLSAIYSRDIRLFPNPSDGNFTVAYTLPVDDKITIEILNMRGEKTALVMNEYRQKGMHQEVVRRDLHAFSAGTYLLGISGTRFKEFRKIVISP